MHLDSASGAQPNVLRFLLLPAGLAAKVDIQTEQLPFMMTASGETSAIGAFLNHNKPALVVGFSNTLLQNGTRILFTATSS
jgi:hypothetical protein